MTLGLERLAIAAAVAVLALAAAAPGASARWPVYGHDIANTRDGVRDGPSPAEAATLTEAWRFTAPSDFTGTPVIANRLVVAGSYDGTVYAIDAVTGKLRWKRTLGQPINGSAAIDTAAAGGPAVYVPLQQVGSPRVAALSLSDGKLRWNTVLTDQPTSSVYSSPVVWNGNVYIGTSGPNGDASTARGTVESLGGATGAVRWRTYVVPPGRDGGAVWSSAAIDPASGRLFIGTGNAYHGSPADTTDAVLALDSGNGQILGHFQALSDDTFAADNPVGPDADFGASPNLLRGSSGRALVGEGAKDGNYYALDRATLAPVWKTALGPGSAAGGFVGSTAYDGFRVYGTNASTSQVGSIDRDGELKWSNADGGSPDFSPVAMANGVLYTVSPAGVLTAREAATGSTLTKVSLGGGTFGGISTTGGAVYTAMGLGPLPSPAPQSTGSGAIVAFGDTSRSGAIDPLPAGRAKKRPRIRLKVRPRRAVAGRRTVFHFRARVGGKPLRRALIRFAHHRARTNRKGRARIVVRLRRGRHRALATKKGYRRGSARVAARRPRR
jgi:polyvinyl alcohol dehydrogenase (cytochrome)